MTFLISSGLLLAALGCAALYLASPNQQWFSQSWRAPPALIGALVLLIAAMFILCHAMQVLTAVFVLTTWIMLLLALFPFLGALVRLYAKRHPS